MFWPGLRLTERTVVNCCLHSDSSRRTSVTYNKYTYPNIILTHITYPYMITPISIPQNVGNSFSTTSAVHFKVYTNVKSEKNKNDRGSNIPNDDFDSEQSVPWKENVAMPEKKPGILQRFKDAYKEYGKVLIGVHLVTSAGWYGAFYYAAKMGIDVVPLLEWLGASQKIIKPFSESGAGDFAVAYLLYELAKVPRYVVTLAGTQMTVTQLRKRGLIEAPAKEDSIRNLVKEGRTQAKTKYSEKKEEIKDKIDDSKDKIKDRIEDQRDIFKHRLEDQKGKIKDRLDDQRDKLKDRLEDSKYKLKDRIEDSKEKLADKLEDSKDKLKDKLDDGTDKVKSKIRKKGK